MYIIPNNIPCEEITRIGPLKSSLLQRMCIRTLKINIKPLVWIITVNSIPPFFVLC